MKSDWCQIFRGHWAWSGKCLVQIWAWSDRWESHNLAKKQKRHAVSLRNLGSANINILGWNLVHRGTRPSQRAWRSQILVILCLNMIRGSMKLPKTFSLLANKKIAHFEGFRVSKIKFRDLHGLQNLVLPYIELFLAQNSNICDSQTHWKGKKQVRKWFRDIYDQSLNFKMTKHTRKIIMKKQTLWWKSWYSKLVSLHFFTSLIMCFMNNCIFHHVQCIIWTFNPKL